MRNPDKSSLEHWFLTRFLDAMGDASPGKISDFIKSESPDWLLVRDDTPQIGIELTELHNEQNGTSGLPPRQEEGIKDRICRSVEKTWVDSGKPHADIRLLFIGQQFPSKNEEAVLVRAVVDLLAERLPPQDGTVTIAEDQLWDHPVLGNIIHYIRICRWEGCTETSVLSAGSIFPPTLAHDLIQTVITRKNGRVDNYRLKCQTVWFVIVHNTHSIATLFVPPNTHSPDPYVTGFDRIFLLDSLKGSITELNRRDP